jgi:hypothetical protein
VQWGSHGSGSNRGGKPRAGLARCGAQGCSADQRARRGIGKQARRAPRLLPRIDWVYLGCAHRLAFVMASGDRDAARGHDRGQDRGQGGSACIAGKTWGQVVRDLRWELPARFYIAVRSAMFTRCAWQRARPHLRTGGRPGARLELCVAVGTRVAPPARIRTCTLMRLRDFDFDHVDKLSCIYSYDFGDSWHHTVTLEKLVAVKPAPRTAICIAGARRCPPEDVAEHTATSSFCAYR